jgi:hypothetical protein
MYFKDLNFLFCPMLLKVKLGRLDGIIVVEPLLTGNTSPSITDRLLCEDDTITFGFVEDFLPELSNFIQFH